MSGQRATVRFTFDGGELAAEAGQSVAGALIGAGIRAWRTTRVAAQPRGAFCGIGICFDCLVTVNGEANVRACLAEVHDGDVVLRQEGAGRAELAR